MLGSFLGLSPSFSPRLGISLNLEQANLASLLAQQAPDVYVSPLPSAPSAGFVFTFLLGFSMDLRDINSGLYAYKTEILLTEPCSQRLLYLFPYLLCLYYFFFKFCYPFGSLLTIHQFHDIKLYYEEICASDLKGGPASSLQSPCVETALLEAISHPYSPGPR